MTFFRYRIRLLNGNEYEEEISVPPGESIIDRINTDANRPVGAYQLLDLVELDPCLGCRENQPNQQAHMDFGGCQYEDPFGEP